MLGNRALLGVLLFAGSALTSCGANLNDPMPPAEEAPPVPPTEHPPEPEPCATGAFCFDAQLADQVQKMTLGSKLTLNTSIVMSSKLKGETVKFSVVTPLSPSELKIDISPSTLVVGDESNIPVTINLQLPTDSPYDGGNTITLHAEVMGPAGMSGDSQALTIPVEPKLVVEYSGKGGMASPHTWTIPGNDPLKIGVAGQQAPTTVKLRSKGVQVMFVNKDTAASHIIHCGGAIAHQPTDKPTPPGGNYTATVQTSGGASCYDHNLESQSVAVYFQFNK